MLLDTIERNDTQKQVRLVCIEVLRSKGEPIPVQNVPTLITLPERHTLTGKAVFDYLLLPGKGKLLIQVQNNNGPAPKLQPTDASTDAFGDINPSAFSFSTSGFGDTFTDINHEGSTIDSGLDDRSYQWTKITDQETTAVSVSNFTPEETRAKKPQMDLETYKMQRDMDLQLDVNPNMVSPPNFPR